MPGVSGVNAARKNARQEIRETRQGTLNNTSRVQDEATLDLVIGKVEFFFQHTGNPLLLGAGKKVHGRHSIPGKDIPVDKTAYVQILHTGWIEVPPILIIEELSDRLIIKTGFYVR